MKKTLIAIIGLAALLASATAQTITLDPATGSLSTNTPLPWVSGPGVDLWNAATTGTNWIVAPYVIKSGDSIGGGIGAVYNFSQYLGTAIRLDWLDNQFWMPSGSLQLQAPLRLFGHLDDQGNRAGGLLTTPFGFFGAATPIGGAAADNGTLVGITGVGLAIRRPDSWSKWLPTGLLYDIEYWSPRVTPEHVNVQHRLGVYWRL